MSEYEQNVGDHEEYPQKEANYKFALGHGFGFDLSLLINDSIVEDEPIEEETANKITEKQDSNDVSDSIGRQSSDCIEWVIEEEKKESEESNKLLFYDPKSELEFPHFEVENECSNGREC